MAVLTPLVFDKAPTNSTGADSADQVRRDLEHFKYLIVEVTSPFLAVIFFVQVLTVSLFLFRSRNEKQFRWLPKVMMLLSSVSILQLVISYILRLFGQIRQWIHYCRVLVIVIDMINYGLLFRYARLQT